MSAPRPLKVDQLWLAAHSSAVRPAVARVVALGVLAALSIIAQLTLMAWLVDAVAVQHRPLSSLLPPLLLLLLMVLLRAVLQGWREQAAARISCQVRQSVRRSLLAAWFQAGPARQQGSAAELASEWIEQVEALHGYYARYLPQQWLTVLVPLLVLLPVFWLDWLAGLLLLLAAPLIPLFMALVGMGAEKLNQQHFHALARLSGQFLDQLRGLTTLQLFAATGRAHKQLAQASDQYRQLTLKTLRVAFLSSAVLEFFSSVAIAMVAIYVGFALLGYIQWGPAAELTLFSGLLVLLLAPEFFQPLRQFAQYYHDRAAALGAARLLRQRQQSLQLANAGEEAGSVPVTARADQSVAVCFSAVDFAYPSTTVMAERPQAPPSVLFAGLSLRIDAGDTVVLQGPSGAGKSTMLQLIAGFLRPQQGRVQVFGEPAGQRPFAWLGQQPFVLQGSWADNLRLVNPQASDNQLWAVLQRVGLDALAAQRPAGLASLLSEAGAGLSGGQLRRLALARALLADYPLLLLDEPTSGLDPQSERIIIDTLRSLAAAGRTLIVASHHPAMLAAAGRIIELDQQGRVISDRRQPGLGEQP